MFYISRLQDYRRIRRHPSHRFGRRYFSIARYKARIADRITLKWQLLISIIPSRRQFVVGALALCSPYLSLAVTSYVVSPSFQLNTSISFFGPPAHAARLEANRIGDRFVVLIPNEIRWTEPFHNKTAEIKPRTSPVLDAYCSLSEQRRGLNRRTSARTLRGPANRSSCPRLGSARHLRV